MAALSIAVLLGAVCVVLALARRRERARADALQAALEARLWEERALGADGLEATVQELRRRTHEANNAFSTALLSAQYLLDASRAEPFSDETRSDLVSVASGMVEALQKLRAQLDRGPKPSTTPRARSPLVEPVELGPLLDACAARVRARHRRVSIGLVGPDPSLRGVRLDVCGGRLGLERALDCVLESAASCARSRVELRASVQRGVDVVALEVEDDGPAFPEESLAQPLEPFGHTRSGAPGLGLYTAERVARASLGSLRRENPESGGARVSLFLPLAAEGEPALRD